VHLTAVPQPGKLQGEVESTGQGKRRQQKRRQSRHCRGRGCHCRKRSSAVVEARKTILREIHAQDGDSSAEDGVVTQGTGAQGMGGALSAGNPTVQLASTEKGLLGDGSLGMRKGLRQLTMQAVAWRRGALWGGLKTSRVALCARARCGGVIVRTPVADRVQKAPYRGGWHV